MLQKNVVLFITFLGGGVVKASLNVHHDATSHMLRIARSAIFVPFRDLLPEEEAMESCNSVGGPRCLFQSINRKSPLISGDLGDRDPSFPTLHRIPLGATDDEAAASASRRFVNSEFRFVDLGSNILLASHAMEGMRWSSARLVPEALIWLPDHFWTRVQQERLEEFRTRGGNDSSRLLSKITDFRLLQEEHTEKVGSETSEDVPLAPATVQEMQDAAQAVAFDEDEDEDYDDEEPDDWDIIGHFLDKMLKEIRRNFRRIFGSSSPPASPAITAPHAQRTAGSRPPARTAAPSKETTTPTLRKVWEGQTRSVAWNIWGANREILRPKSRLDATFDASPAAPYLLNGIWDMQAIDNPMDDHDMGDGVAHTDTCLCLGSRFGSFVWPGGRTLVTLPVSAIILSDTPREEVDTIGIEISGIFNRNEIWKQFFTLRAEDGWIDALRLVVARPPSRIDEIHFRIKTGGESSSYLCVGRLSVSAPQVAIAYGGSLEALAAERRQTPEIEEVFESFVRERHRLIEESPSAPPLDVMGVFVVSTGPIQKLGKEGRTHRVIPSEDLSSRLSLEALRSSRDSHYEFLRTWRSPQSGVADGDTSWSRNIRTGGESLVGGRDSRHPADTIDFVAGPIPVETPGLVSLDEADAYRKVLVFQPVMSTTSKFLYQRPSAAELEISAESLKDILAQVLPAHVLEQIVNGDADVKVGQLKIAVQPQEPPGPAPQGQRQPPHPTDPPHPAVQSPSPEAMRRHIEEALGEASRRKLQETRDDRPPLPSRRHPRPQTDGPFTEAQAESHSKRHSAAVSEAMKQHEAAHEAAVAAAKTKLTLEVESQRGEADDSERQQEERGQ